MATRKKAGQKKEALEKEALEEITKIKVVAKARRMVNPFTQEVFNINQPLLAELDSWLDCQLAAGLLRKVS
jgi:hypothetical protein